MGFAPGDGLPEGAEKLDNLVLFAHPGKFREILTAPIQRRRRDIG
jgi:hypothetical protein